MPFWDLTPSCSKRHTAFQQFMEAKRKQQLRSQATRGGISVALLLALAVLTGCQGLSTAKPAVQGTQTPVTGALTASPASVSFGSVQTSTTKTQSETLTNAGGSSVTITQVGVTGAGFGTSGLNLPMILTAGQSATFSVTFESQSSGSFNGSMAVTSNASNPNLSIPLSGSTTSTTQSPQGQLIVSPATINTGSVTVGTTGIQTGSLTASGASVSVTSANVIGSEFAISGLSFPVTIPAGQSVNFTVTFTPQTGGVASVDASFTSDASNSPADATFTGTGVAAPVHTVLLSWTASKSSNIVGYNVYRSSTGANGSYEQINSGLDGNTSYTDTSVVDGTTYFYETTAVNSSDAESARSTPVSAAIPAP